MPTITTKAVEGPASSIDGQAVGFDGTTGKKVKVSTSIGTGDVIGPSSATGDRVATFNSTSGKVIKDGGSTVAQIVAAGAAAAPQGDVVGPGSATDESLALFNGTTGKLIKTGNNISNFPYTTKLGMPVSFNSGYATSVNNLGVSVGTVSISGAAHPVKWSLDGTFTDLGIPPTATVSIVSDINDLGAMVGRGTVGGVVHPFKWTAGGVPTDLGLPLSATTARVTAVNNSGVMVGNATITAVVHPIKWAADGTPTNLDPTGITEGQADDINDSGVAVGYVVVDGVKHPYKWAADGTPTDLGLPPTSTDCSVLSINNSGIMCGYAYVGGDAAAVRWAADGTPTYLTPPTGASSSFANIVNNLNVIVGSCQIEELGSDSFVCKWDASGTPTNLGRFGSAASYIWDLNDSGTMVGQTNDGVILPLIVPLFLTSLPLANDNQNGLLSLLDYSNLGDVTGPAGAEDDNIVVFNSTTGKVVKDGGYTIAEVLAAGGGIQGTQTATLLEVKTGTLIAHKQEIKTFGPPTDVVLTPLTTGGTLADGTYYVRVQFWPNEGDYPSLSDAVSTTITGGGGSGSIGVAWTDPVGVTLNWCAFAVGIGHTPDVDDVWYENEDTNPDVITSLVDGGGSAPYVWTISPLDPLIIIGSGLLSDTVAIAGAEFIADSGGIAIGYGAKCVYDSVVVGNNALVYNTTGIHNVALGNNALANNIGGSGNLALGYQALFNNTTGILNVALGFKALVNNIGGNINIALGSYALFNNTTGDSNVALGYGALSRNTTGDFNTAIGYDALAGNITGDSNVALGYQAGRYELDSGAFYVNNQDRTDTAGDKAKSLLYGTFHATPASQTLKCNGTFDVLASNTLTLSAYGEMFQYGNANPIAIATNAEYYALTLMNTGTLKGFTFIAGVGDGPGASITSVADATGGDITVFATGTWVTGQPVTLHGTTDYDGKYLINTGGTGSFVITATYTQTRTGIARGACALKVSAGSAGVYRVAFNASAHSAGNSKIWHVEVNKNVADIDNIASKAQSSANSTYRNLGASGIVTLADGDVIWMTLKNDTDATNITVEFMNMNLTRIG